MKLVGFGSVLEGRGSRGAGATEFVRDVRRDPELPARAFKVISRVQGCRAGRNLVCLGRVARYHPS